MAETPHERPWLAALKRSLAESEPHDQAVNQEPLLPATSPLEVLECVDHRGAKSAKTSHEVPAPPDRPVVDFLTVEEERAVAWRVAVLQAQIPPTGPIGYLTARPTDPRRDQPDHCGSCGEPREPSQQFDCRACQVAKEQALNAVREGVTA
jgi:hypothetical protein